MAFSSRASVRSGILTSLKTSATTGKRGVAPKSLRVPARVKSDEINPLKRLAKSTDAPLAGAKNRSPFAG